MKTINKLLMVILGITVFAFAASAQQGARRNGTVTARQEASAERKQEKVDRAQTPTSVSNQSATDNKLRQIPDTQGARRNGTESRSGSAGSVNSNGSSSGSVYGGNGGANVNGGYGANGGGNVNGGNVSGGGKPSNSGNNSGIESRSGNTAGSVNGTVHGGSGNAGYGNGGYNGGYGNGGYSGGAGYGGPAGNRPPAGHGYGAGYGKPYVPGYNNAYPGNRPPMPTVRTYTKVQVYDRTNAAEIVVNTLFSSKMEAYYYIARLLDERYYTVSSYGNNYNWLRSDVSFIPTPFDWADPMTHNQFRMYFKIYKSCGRIRVAITAQWRESVLSDRFLTLRFQPSNTYSTYYAWNVLEDIADNIPNTGIYFRTADIL